MINSLENDKVQKFHRTSTFIFCTTFGVYAKNGFWHNLGTAGLTHAQGDEDKMR